MGIERWYIGCSKNSLWRVVVHYWSTESARWNRAQRSYRSRFLRENCTISRVQKSTLATNDVLVVGFTALQKTAELRPLRGNILECMDDGPTASFKSVRVIWMLLVLKFLYSVFSSSEKLPNLFWLLMFQLQSFIFLYKISHRSS